MIYVGMAAGVFFGIFGTIAWQNFSRIWATVSQAEAMRNGPSKAAKK